MLEWVLKYWLEAVFGVVTAMLAWGYRRLERKLKEQDAIKYGIQALLRDRIIQTYNHYMDKGHCPIYAMDNVEAMYKQYSALDGNGTVTELVERLREMPTREDEAHVGNAE